jgi:hypothetical protein
MAYAEQNATKQPADSLMSDGAHINDRLNTVADRLRKIGDTLHGSGPRDAGAPAGAKVEPAPTMRRYFDAAHAAIHEIESELARIESRL